MRKLLVVSALLVLGVFLVGEGLVAAAAGQRSIEEFVSAQGTFCLYPDLTGGTYEDPCPPDSLLLVPPVANFAGWYDTAEGEEKSASVDYAGLADLWAEEETGERAFGTETTGTVTERPLKDGRAEVHVRLHTRNALSWVVDGFDFNDGDLLFGHRAPEVVLEGAEAALGESFLHLKFINTAPGDPLPDLIQLAFFPEPDQEIIIISLYARADGPLPDETPGRLQVAQTGLLMTGFHGAVADGFPVENIIVHPVGQ